MDDTIAQAEHALDESHILRPLEFLTPDEREEIQATAIELSRLCRRLCAIDREWCVREAASRRRSHYNAADDNGNLREEATKASQIHSEGTLPSEMGRQEGDCHDSPGESGMHGSGPLWHINLNIQAAISRIGTLLRIESLQTTSDLRDVLPSVHLSDDEDTHGHTGISIVHNSFR